MTAALLKRPASQRGWEGLSAYPPSDDGGPIEASHAQRTSHKAQSTIRRLMTAALLKLAYYIALFLRRFRLSAV